MQAARSAKDRSLYLWELPLFYPIAIKLVSGRRCRACCASAAVTGLENWVRTLLIVWMGVNKGMLLLLGNGSCKREETGRGMLA